MSNIYYNPEEFELEIFEEVEKERDCDFDKFVVWKQKEGGLFYANDSGCSCPSPFEDYHSIADLTPINKHSFESFVNDLESWSKTVNDGFKITVAEKIGLIQKVKKWLEGEE